MIQLRTEGWIHHLARHAVACFLTRGDLWVSWELGQQVHELIIFNGPTAITKTGIFGNNRYLKNGCLTLIGV